MAYMNLATQKIIIDRYGAFLSWIYRLVTFNKFRCGGGRIILKGVFAKRCDFRVFGKNNVIEVEPGYTRLTNCKIRIFGSNSKVSIGRDCNLTNLNIWMEDDNTEVQIGKHVSITGRTSLSAIEGTKITIGDNCLFSQEIDFRTGDSHSILDSDGNRINPSKDISIGNHVWIGHSVKILKNTVIGNNSIVATGAIIAGGEYPDNVIVGGVGGRILKDDVNWEKERIPINNI